MKHNHQGGRAVSDRNTNISVEGGRAVEKTHGDISVEDGRGVEETYICVEGEWAVEETHQV